MVTILVYLILLAFDFIATFLGLLVAFSGFPAVFRPAFFAVTFLAGAFLAFGILEFPSPTIRLE